ncbi:T9SS type A sorting domain-containing protein [Aquimarina agarivorans]|uniref:T9SS type A sorting domain-containing protein n=1 Tax=Aquimarina agarivorans TaxID=980584 RepID=UPI000248ED6C|nr:T9SS type A sorting domain-containing protein [Aquimarina agarivorans]
MKLRLHKLKLLKRITNLLVTLTISQTMIGQATSDTANCSYDTPRNSPMPIMNYRSYNTDTNFEGNITVFGKNGPDLSPYRKLDIAYTNGELSTFFFQLFGGAGQVNLIPNTVINFEQTEPELTISNSGIENFDGSYYTNIIDNGMRVDLHDFVMVSKTGDFSIYFGNLDAPVACTDEAITPDESLTYDESLNGNLSTDNNNPTLIEFKPGDNRIASTQQTGDAANFFTFQIPEGYELSQLIVDNYDGSDDIGFIGINNDSSISTAPAIFKGGLSYGTANIGTDILPAMGDASNPAAIAITGFGFTPPLRDNQYTVWLNQTGLNSSSVLNFVISAKETTLSVPDINVENGIVLKQNYPNPFKNATTLEYSLSKKSTVKLNIYNLQGQLVKSLNDGVQSSGSHKLTFNLNEMSNGVYISVLVTDNGNQKQFIVLDK